MYHHPVYDAPFNGLGKVTIPHRTSAPTAAPVAPIPGAAKRPLIVIPTAQSKQCADQGGDWDNSTQKCIAKATGIPTYVWIGLGVVAMGGAYYFIKVRK